MKLMIASDIHGAAGYCRDLLAAHDREGRPRLLLLGDILYHGPLPPYLRRNHRRGALQPV